MKMKTAILTAAALLMTAGTSYAAPAKYHNNGYGYGKPTFHRGISPAERVMIARSAANVAAVKHQAWRDGRITFLERVRINSAERRHAAVVARAYRS